MNTIGKNRATFEYHKLQTVTAMRVKRVRDNAGSGIVSITTASGHRVCIRAAVDKDTGHAVLIHRQKVRKRVVAQKRVGRKTERKVEPARWINTFTYIPLDVLALAQRNLEVIQHARHWTIKDAVR